MMTTNNAVNVGLEGATGTGNFVGSSSPSLVTPNIGTPSAGVLTNCTGLPLASITGFGTGIETFLATNPGNSSVLVTSNAGAISWQGLTNGQLLIGYTDGTPTAATLTAGTGVSITNAAGSITIAASPSGADGLLNVQYFTSGGTYTPTSGMTYCIIQCVGGGGAGGGSNSQSAGGGGGAGGYSQSYVSAATIGASQTVTIGAGGTGVSNNNGNNGGNTSVGTIVIANGGTGGAVGILQNIVAGAAGGTAGTGDITATGGSGGLGIDTNVTSTTVSGTGGNSYFSSGAVSVSATTGIAATGTNAAANSGAGGSGSASAAAGGTATGGNGGSGICVIYEYG